MVTEVSWLAGGGVELALDLLADPAAGEVVVDDAAGLHRRPDGRRSDEAEARHLQPLRQLLRLRRLREPVGCSARRLVRLRPIRPDQLMQRRSGLAQREHAARVRDRRLDLAAVADDAGIRQQALDVALAEAGDGVGVEAGERPPEALPLAQDRQPGQTRLEALETEALVEPEL